MDIMPVDTATGPIATFDTELAVPLVNVSCDVVATGGNGTPDSPIPINGYTEANITANGNTYTIAFGQTVYGGVLDVTRGKLTVDMYRFTTDFTGASDIGGGFYRKAISIPYNAVYPAVKPQLCNVAPYQASYSGQFTHFYCNLDTAIIILPDNTPTSTEIEIVFELATPFDIDLTPEVISAVVGTNNVYSDTNGDTTVKFKDSIQHYIDNH